MWCGYCRDGLIYWVWVSEQTDDREFLVRVSYMEIYNEEINDLLTLEGRRLPIKENLEVNARSPLGIILIFLDRFL